MTNAELLAKIKAEIERLLNEAPTCDDTIAYLMKVECFLDTLESEKPIDPETAMKELDEKIALVKQRGSWDGVDVDKYMDEVRGREPEKPMELEEEVKRYYSDNFAYLSSDQPTLSILTNIARHFTDWQKERLFMDGLDAVRSDSPNKIEKTIAGVFVKYGMDSMKEQMMKDAVEGEVCGRVYDHINVRFADGVCKFLEPKNISHIPADVSKYKVGDKVRIIIVKE